MGWNIFHQNTSCIDRSVFSHRHARKNDHIVSNPSVFVDDNWLFLSCATFLQKIGDHHIHTIPSHIRVIFLDAKLMMLTYPFPLYTFLSIILGKCVYLHKTHLKNVIDIQFAQ